MVERKVFRSATPRSGNPAPPSPDDEHSTVSVSRERVDFNDYITPSQACIKPMGTNDAPAGDSEMVTGAALVKPGCVRRPRLSESPDTDSR